MSAQSPKPVIRPEPKVTLELALEHGLTKDEYDRILKILGRVPTYTELGIYSVMWSEHCSYKNSIALLKTLPRSGGKLMVNAGEENAGLVDIGDGLAVAFKIESHNHPSAVEPYQGAATGVGGILRDIFSMGARPIAVLNSLRFGSLSDARSQYLFKRVVKGIADYGNSFGVPTVAGEVYFDDCYRLNPLVNAMAVGIVEHGKVAKAIASGTGNSVMIVGSFTGRDGIHGATFASEEISEKSEAKRPAVQVGDPFVEKLLLEATLEAIGTGFIIGVQDMGAAGITCSTTEMSAKGNTGMKLDLDRVPLRETGMTSYEIMLSESQERMLFVVKKGHEADVNKIFDKWDLHAEVIGTVEAGDSVKISVGGNQVANVPAQSLVLGGEAPVYTRDSKEPTYLTRTRGFRTSSIPAPSDYVKVLKALLRSHSIASKHWVYEQYDSMVRTNSLITASGDAAVVRVKGTRKGLAVKVDCNAAYVYLNPRRGASIAVAEAARNVVCTGARPLAITNCLNFGNPYDPEVYWQFKEAVAGIGEACRILETPVTGGNVSFYNESHEESVYPTPVIGMLGLLDDAGLAISAEFKHPGDDVWILGRNLGEIGGSAYLQQVTGKLQGDIPELDLEYEKKVQDCCLDIIEKRLIGSAHDVSEGGLAVALAECAIEAQGNIGVEILEGHRNGMRKDFELFGESQSRIIISSHSRNRSEVESICKENTVEIQRIGSVINEPVIVIKPEIRLSVEEARGLYENAIEDALTGVV
ncbi:MAG: phosphoribosylformylglycinamidine synthase subunit PurL [Bacteroidota bacterium]